MKRTTRMLTDLFIISSEFLCIPCYQYSIHKSKICTKNNRFWAECVKPDIKLVKHAVGNVEILLLYTRKTKLSFMPVKIYIVLLLFFFTFPIVAQSEKKMKSPQKIESNSLNRSASQLSKYLDENESEEKIAAEYETLAKELVNQKEYSKAEEYLKRAKQVYLKQNNQEKLYILNRELARVQELQKHYDEAIKNYSEAATHTNDKEKQLICENDINRLKNIVNPEKQTVYLQQNIALLEKKGEPAEKAAAYEQMAETNLQMNQREVALDNYQKALQQVDNENVKSVDLQNKIAEVYVADKQYDKAIVLKNVQVEEASKRADIKDQIEQLQTLSSVYLMDDQKEQGIASLQQAYDLALEKGRTIEAKKSLQLLAEQYLEEKNYKESIQLYKSFLNNLEPLIQSDSSLIDAKVFQLTETRINQLEKERDLQNQLIEEKNTFNTVLVGSVILMVILIFFVVKALYDNKIKNKKIALQSLRREMNPHFIFNSLNSVNQFIAQNNELEANKFLTSYSRLMRNAMENSNKDFIKLNKEIDQLKEYLSLEHLRFQDQFSYEVIVAENIDTESISVPNMIIQPHLENAIWHGLRYKEEKGLLKLHFTISGNQLVITIEDDGIGLEKSREIKTKNQKVHQSRGLTNVSERIELLNKLYKTNIRFQVVDKTDEQSGVVVKIYIPIRVIRVP